MNLVPELVNNGVAITERQLHVDYNFALVLLSYVLAGIASYVTLRLIGHFRMSVDPGQRRVLIGIAAMTLGGGIWGMHCVGMLAANWPVEVSYDLLLTGLSLLVPIAVCGLGLFWMRIAAVSLRRLLVSGAVTGLSIALMHYIGMAAMRASVQMLYRTDLFVLSIVIGIAAAVAAFRFGRRFSSVGHAEPGFFLSAGTAGLMAIAICGMHYTGMAALIVIDRPTLGFGALFAIEPNIMATMIALTLLAVLGAAQLTLALDTDTSGRARIAILPLLMAAVAAGSGGTAAAVLYDAALDLERNEMLDVVRVQREFIEAVAYFDTRYSTTDVAGGADAATLG